MKSLKLALCAVVLFLSACSSNDKNYIDSNESYSSTPGYQSATLGEFVLVYQSVKEKGCKRFANDPTFVYTCDDLNSDEDYAVSSLTIVTTGVRADRGVTYCAYWSSFEYCSSGRRMRW